MSRFRKNVDACNDGNAPKGYCANQDYSEDSDYLVHDIAQHTNLRSGPHELLSRGVPGKRKLPVSPIKIRYLPVNGPRWVDRLQSRAYVSQFSADGSLFVAGFQKSHIRIYDVDKGWKVQKNILAKSLKWTITDTSLSPDQRFLVYSSLSPVVHIVNVRSAASESIANITEIHDGLDFSVDDYDDDDYDALGIFSVKFSTDGKELVAASSDNSIYVYDLESKRPSLRIPAHKSDVNTVCFADETGHLLFSGSDDHLCKVWDRRCFGTRGKAAGVLIGHLEGITFIDSRGDGRYFISNGKDQTTKLWDIRKMSSNTPYTRRPRDTDFDYRWMDYPTHARALKHPHDQSLANNIQRPQCVAYFDSLLLLSHIGNLFWNLASSKLFLRPHDLISFLSLLLGFRERPYTASLCRFQIAGNQNGIIFAGLIGTGQKYIYTGSSDGSLYIYDLVTGAQVASCHGHEKPVRDCSWHTYIQFITSSWDGVIARWEFPGNEEEPSETRGRARRPSF
ncbi:hypothetical protein CXB51_025667 [Gossypium anomalum]|uniref:LEC14B homolog n=1 Tax=Gossypium anomalum TaxID=47600 RepID=A0A8J5Y3H6_9ROSI|nr:hypothetical protein CXB51_025667 [Gossypium anomalum]